MLRAMWRKSCSIVAITSVALLASCSSKPYFVAKNEPWRRDYEVACLKSGAVRESAFVSGGPSINGPSVCGAVRPFTLQATANGAVGFKPAAKVQCSMVPAIDRWTRETVMPAAEQYYGMGVVEMRVLSSYSCRPRNGQAGGQLSEHGFANAIDVGSFLLADGREVKVLTGWNGSAADRGFLRAVHAGGCRLFTTTIGPNANAFHRDHFHFDLAPRTRNTRTYCK
jgi:hypothetical protein